MAFLRVNVYAIFLAEKSIGEITGKEKLPVMDIFTGITESYLPENSRMESIMERIHCTAGTAPCLSASSVKES